MQPEEAAAAAADAAAAAAADAAAAAACHQASHPAPAGRRHIAHIQGGRPARQRLRHSSPDTIGGDEGFCLAVYV